MEMSDLNKELKWIVPAMAACIFGLGIAVGKTVRAAEIPITGTVQSQCSINTDVPGIYGSPNAYTLSTTPADGGVVPVVRYDVTLADAYKAKITYPTDFSSSPSLSDSVTWTGSVTVDQVSSVDMADYQTDSTTYDQTREYVLSATGATWFAVASTATYGGGSQKAFPGGTYRAVVVAECVAN
jgi:hypothetical protein